MRKPIVIGIVGGVASGKSFVANELVRLGAGLIDADTIGHEILNQPLVARTLVQEFGPGILQSPTSDSTQQPGVSRAAIAAIVFSTDASASAKRKRLEEILHPLIQADAVRKLRLYIEADPPPPAIVIDAPLLLEAGWRAMCDWVIFVDATQELRWRRAQARGWTAEEFAAREAAQMPLPEKRAASTHTINSSDDEQQLRQELAQLWDTRNQT